MGQLRLRKWQSQCWKPEPVALSMAMWGLHRTPAPLAGWERTHPGGVSIELRLEISHSPLSHLPSSVGLRVHLSSFTLDFRITKVCKWTGECWDTALEFQNKSCSKSPLWLFIIINNQVRGSGGVQSLSDWWITTSPCYLLMPLLLQLNLPVTIFQ